MNKQHTQLDTVNSLIEQIEASINNNYRDGRLKISLNSNNQNLKFILRYFMPYCTEKLKNGKVIFLNRGYKPLGVTYESINPMINYEEYENVSFDKEPKEDSHFYNDGSTPWSSRKDLNNYIKSLKAYINS